MELCFPVLAVRVCKEGGVMIEAKIENYSKEEIGYITAFAKKHNLSIEEALQHAQVKEYLKIHVEERKGKI